MSRRVIGIGMSWQADLSNLKEMNQSGEGTIYETDQDWVLKIFHDPEGSQAGKIDILSKCSSKRTALWDGLRSVATVPEWFVQNEQGKTVGYLMKRIPGSKTLQSLYNGSSIKDTLQSFISLHASLSMMHKQGFAVGDLNGGNIMLCQDGNGMKAWLIDTDSWTINRPDLGIVYCPMIQNQEVLHPDHLSAKATGQALPAFIPKHDWWIFSYLLTKCLAGSDPFEHGSFFNFSDTDRRKMGYTAMHRGVDLGSPEEYAAYVRMGIPMKHLLKRWLSIAQTGPFPINLLQSTLEELIRCPNCRREINGRLVLCPYPDCTTML